MKKTISLILTFVMLATAICAFPTTVGAANNVDRVITASLTIIGYNEGNYASVNANDNGALSIGKLQWHAGRALSLMRTIVNSLGATSAKSYIGETLYNEIVSSSTSWSTRKLSSDEKTLFAAILKTDASHTAQDNLARNDVGTYVNHGIQRGITSDAALVYYSDIENQYGAGSQAANNGAWAIVNKVKNYLGKTTIDSLDEFHNAVLQVVSNYLTRRTRTYNNVKKLGWEDESVIDPDNYTLPTRALYYNSSSIMSGNDVSWVQAVLTKLGYTLSVDGQFGPATDTQVKAYQTAKGLTSNGRVEGQTLTQLQIDWELIDPNQDTDLLNCVVAINAIGTVTAQSGSTIEYVESLYNALSAAQKAQVTNYSTLTAARAAYNQLTATTRSYTVSVPSSSSYAGTSASFSGAVNFNSANGTTDGCGYMNYEPNPTAAYRATMDFVYNGAVETDPYRNSDQGVILAMLGSGKTMGYNFATGKYFIAGGGGGWSGDPTYYIAQSAGTISAGGYYRFEYVVEANKLSLVVNGTTVVSANVSGAFSSGQYFIFYPKHVNIDITYTKLEYLDGSSTPFTGSGSNALTGYVGYNAAGNPYTTIADTINVTFNSVAVTNYTVSFNMNGHGSQIAAQTVAAGSTATQPTAPTASGYTFGGWYTNAACTSAFSFSTAINANTTLYAKWTENPVYYTVSFNMNGHGSAISSQSVLKGSTATQPTAPTASGYTFGGWYTNAACTSAFSFSTAINANTTLYAKWTENPVYYTVSFNMNGHGSAISSQSVLKGSTATQPTAPSASGYTFGGWYTNAACTSAFSFSTAINANTTLYAKWTENPVYYTVSFNMNGHGSAISSQSVLKGSTATQPTAPTASGYTFGGWYTNAACTSAFSFSTAINANTTLYAKWTEAVHVHTPVYVAAISGTCTAAGTAAHYRCSGCSKLFADAAGTIETTIAALATPALGHDHKISSTTATCTEAGTTVYTCSRCGDSYTVAGEALGHDYRVTSHKNPTCTASGYDFLTCSHDSSHTKFETIPALGHTFAGGVCTVCGEADPNYAAPGDFDGDGHINAADVISLMRYIVKAAGSVEYSAQADFNGDGAVNNKDVLRMMLAIANGEN